MKFGNKFIYKNRIINTIAFSIITFIILEVIIIKEGFQGGGINYPNITAAVEAVINMSDSDYYMFSQANNLSAQNNIANAALEKTNLAMINIFNVKNIAADARLADAWNRTELATCLDPKGIRVSCNTGILDPCCAIERELILDEANKINAVETAAAILKTDNIRIGSRIRVRAIYGAFVAGVPAVHFLAADDAAEIALIAGATRAQVIAAGEAAAIKVGATPAQALLAGEAAAATEFAIFKARAETPPPTTPPTRPPTIPPTIPPTRPPTTPPSITPPPPKDDGSNTILILGGISVVVVGGALIYMSIPKG